MANDFFADIASSYAVDASRGLIFPCPPVLPDKEIKLEPGDKARFTPYKKMDTKEELAAELKRVREKHAPFLRDLAPALESKVQHWELTDFTWSLDGAEPVEVKLPHYGEKVGRHTAVYETIFSLDCFCGKRVILGFQGVDYIAEVYVNDKFVGRHEGFFSPFEFDVTDVAEKGQNRLRVVVKNDFTMTGNACAEGLKIDGDKIYAATGPGWDEAMVGWHHCPAGMGIYNRVFVELREPQYLTDIFVRNGEEVWIECVSAELPEKNVSFEVSIYGQNFDETVCEDVKLEPTTTIEAGVGDTLTEADLIAQGKLGKGTPLRMGNGYNRFIFPISMKDKKIWTPDTPYLYQIQVKLLVDGKVTSTRKRQFGIRTFTEDKESSPKGMFYLNGEKVKLRGANTMGFEQWDVMRGDFDQLIDDILLAKICNMNFLRLTQRPVQEEIYDYCDRLGLMIQTDLPLFGTIRINQYCETLRQVEEMEKLIRSHACCILATYINEPFPNACNKPHRMIKRADMMRFFEAADNIIHLHNPERVTKHVDGDYDPPSETLPDNHCYTMWYNGHGLDLGMLHKGYWLEVKPDWYYGCGEFGAEGLDFPEVMKEYYPKEWMQEPFNPSDIVGAQTGDFHYFFYETPKTMDEWVKESHRHQVFATKTMTNAMRRNNSFVTFAIHLFIDAWPAGWMKTIMDCKRNPKPAYFAYQDSLTPLMANLRSDRFTCFGGQALRVESYICNDKAALSGAKVCYMAEMDGKVIASAEQPAVIDACSTVFQGYAVIDTPKVDCRKKLTLTMAIVKDGEVLHYTSEDYTIFPELQVQVPELMDYAAYAANRAAVDEEIKNGRTVIFAPLAQGEYEIAGKTVQVKNCGMHPVYFVSRDTGHPLVQGFEKNDFAYWYDEKLDRLAPIMYASFTCDGIETVLSSGNKDDVGNWVKTNACGTFAVGKGNVIICQIGLQNVKSNPVCAQFVKSLME